MVEYKLKIYTEPTYSKFNIKIMGLCKEKKITIEY